MATQRLAGRMVPLRLPARYRLPAIAPDEEGMRGGVAEMSLEAATSCRSNARPRARQMLLFRAARRGRRCGISDLRLLAPKRRRLRRPPWSIAGLAGARRAMRAASRPRR